MTKFKVGDRVRVGEVIGRDHTFGLRVGQIRQVTKIDEHYLALTDTKTAYFLDDIDRPMWEKQLEADTTTDGKDPVRFILQYELDRDPFETFATMQEVEDRIRELAKRSDLKRESIKVYEVAKTYDVTLETRILFGPKVKMTTKSVGRPKGSTKKVARKKRAVRRYETEEQRKAAKRAAYKRWYRRQKAAA